MESFLEAFLTAIAKSELGSLCAGAPVFVLAYCPHQNTCRATEILFLLGKCCVLVIATKNWANSEAASMLLIPKIVPRILPAVIRKMKED